MDSGNRTTDGADVGRRSSEVEARPGRPPRQGRLSLAHVCLALATTAVLVGAVGCGNRPRVLTGELQGRRIASFEVAGDWMVYTWTDLLGGGGRSPAIHLAVRNLETGQETELEEDWLPSGRFALDGARVAYSTGTPPEGGDIVLYDAAAGTKSTVTQAKVSWLDLDGGRLVMEEIIDGGSTVVLVDVETGEREELSGDLSGENDRRPRIDAGKVVWTRYDRRADSSRLVVHDLAASATSVTEVAHPGRFNVDLSGGHAVYVVYGENEPTIYLYRVSDGSESVVANGKRLLGEPHVTGNTVVWAEKVSREEFKPVAGQPLIDEQDFRNIYRYDIASGKSTRVASSLFWPAGHRPGQLADKDGRVYATVAPEVPGRGENISARRVDVWRW